jgi:DNA (cytosine-5)-methyltransferase 1
LSAPSEFAIVDLFAGPGGLAEGFSAVRNKDGSRPFRIELSIEKEPTAFATLRLRSFLRQFPDRFPEEYYQFLNGHIQEPDWSESYPAEWLKACKETLLLELGTPEAQREVDVYLSDIVSRHHGNTILIGGPPCQAYSLVGRARNKGILGYSASEDHRHFLYKEYIRIVEKLKPAFFVMENVKGMLSSTVNGERVFDRVLEDLAYVDEGGYKLMPLAPRSKNPRPLLGTHLPATDFIIRSEEHGVPQARHRVIVIGVRSDMLSKFPDMNLAAIQLSRSEPVATVRDVLSQMPRLRSGLSEQVDAADTWQSEVSRVMRNVIEMDTGLPDFQQKEFSSSGKKIASNLSNCTTSLRRTEGTYAGVAKSCSVGLNEWLVDKWISRFSNHETRGHMVSDLARYFFVALYGLVAHTSPKAPDFPSELCPHHRNWNSGKFADRFRVQLWDFPATTITSHISKDGHYFIHPDPAQCRSLTVREAARLQTFPDNYFFKGNRTQQFVQVGNAVPPFLAYKIAGALQSFLAASNDTPPA